MTITRKRDQRVRHPELLRLLRDDGPLSKPELARRLNCQLQTVQRDLRFLKTQGHPIYDTEERPARHGLHPSPPGHQDLDPVRAVVQHALQRLLHHHAPTPSRVYHETLMQLTGQLPARLRHISQKALTPPSGETPRILETIAAAWCYAQPIRFTYQKPSHAPERGEAHVIFMEVNRNNLDWYVFCQRVGEQKVKTFHLSRFQDVTRLTHQTSPDIPFDPRQELDGAWGIIGGDQHSDLKLRFDPEVVPYVAYRSWPGQLHAHMDGEHYVLTVRAPLAHNQFPFEVMAWIRSWGPRVELISPLNLREAWLQEAREIMRRHGP